MRQASVTQGECQLTSRETALTVAVLEAEAEVEGTCSSSSRWSLFGVGGSESDSSSSSEVDGSKTTGGS